MAKLDVMLWNKEKTESVHASKIRNFGLYVDSFDTRKATGYKLLGWFSSSEYFYFGLWDTKEEAGAYLNELHKQIEGR